MDDDWDLQAVVRGCSIAGAGAGAASTTTATSTTSSSVFMADFQAVSTTSSSSSLFSSSYSPFGFSQHHGSSGQLFLLPDPNNFRPRNVVVEELHELYKPFFPTSQTQIQIQTQTQTQTPLSSLSSICSSSTASTITTTRSNDQIRQLKQAHQPTKQSLNNASSTTPRSKKRRNQLKKVCQVPAESLSSDIWAWRKYGQKPIKGSPYPRGYYRCSSSKGCLARKQVERNRVDPGMFIVTYTAEHNHPAPTHRNSLAGSTRQKPSTPQSISGATGEPNNPATKPSSPATSCEEELAVPQAHSTTTESKDGPDSVLMDDDDEDELGFSDMAVSDDFFVGLEGLGGPATGDVFSDHFSSSFPLPWVANNAATAASGS